MYIEKQFPEHPAPQPAVIDALFRLFPPPPKISIVRKKLQKLAMISMDGKTNFAKYQLNWKPHKLTQF
jgi:hypothetical protein